ncbi:MAG: XdhC family protein [Actinomycetota bacterium]
MVNLTVKAIAHLTEAERLGGTVTVIDGPGLGSTVVVDRTDGVVAGERGDWLTDEMLTDAYALMDREQSRSLIYGERRVFIDTMAPRPTMLIFGAGHIAQPLSVIAGELGFRVVVADARAAWATQERFPHVDELIVAWPGSVFDHIEPDSRMYVVMLSHDSRFEIPVFDAVHDTPIKYLGAMGSRRTHAMRVERLRADGWTDDQIDSIHGPIGLDLKGKTPAETAVAIAGEVILVRYGGGTALSLSGIDAAIHGD